MRRRWAALVVAVAASLVPPARLPAQGTQPLRKTDMIRLLTAGGLRAPEIANLVRRNCLAFQPTPRDRTDLQAAGADSVILSAVDQCTRRRGGGGGGGRGAGARDVLRVVAQPRVFAPAGTEATLTARLVQGRTPQQRVPLKLKGSASIPGGLTQEALAFTDPQGFATFHVLTGTKVATYRLTVAPADGTPIRAGEIELTTTPAREVRAAVTPAELLLHEGTSSGGVVRVTVTDGYGNPVAGLGVRLGSVTATLAAPLPARVTDEQGQASFPIALGVVRREGQLGVFSPDAQIGSFTVRLRSLVLSETRTRFVTGADQRAPAGTPLAEPLVFEVRDTAGAPAPGQTVSLSATGGAVIPALAPTDASGSVRAHVTLGERAGPVVITATVGSLSRSATVYADPGAPHELLVFEDSTRVMGSLMLKSRNAVVLRVVARDSHGNETAISTFAAIATAPAIRLKAATVTGSEGVVTLEARHGGAADLELRAGGVEARLPVEVTLPALSEQWVFGARGSWTGFTYTFAPIPYVHGRPGVRAEFFAGLAISPRLRTELVGGLGVLNADTGSVQKPVSLKQVYARAEYTFLSEAPVRSVVSLGSGIFRILSDDPGHVVYHNSWFWLIGLGADVSVSPHVIGEFRIETQQLNEMNSKYINGHVGALTVVEAGVRLSP